MSSQSSSSEAWAAITPVDLVRTVFRRLPSVLVTAAVVSVVVAALLWVWPNRYASDGLFYARLGRGAVSVDPTTDPSASVSLQESRASEVASISEMITSREIADRVVKRVGAREINYPRTWIDRTLSSVQSWMPSSTASFDGGDKPATDGSPGKPSSNDEEATAPYAATNSSRLASSINAASSDLDRTEYARQIAHEEAVKRVRNAITVTVPKNSYTVSVVANASDPILAQKIVQAIMDEFGAYHVRAHQSSGSTDFFIEQTEASHQAAIDARQALQTARSEMGWISTQAAEESLRQRILELELALDQADSEWADAKRRTESLAARIKTVEEWIPMELTRVANNAADDMRTALYEYQLEDGEKLSRLSANHPRYKVLQGKIDQGKEIVASTNDDREETVEAINPIRLGLEKDYQTSMTSAAGFESRRESLLKSLASARADLKRLNTDAVKLAELTWAADVAERNYLSHCERLETSRMTSDLDAKQMSDISVIQNASLNLKKVGPPRALLALVGGLFGLCLGMLQALVREPVGGAPALSRRKEIDQDPRMQPHESYDEPSDFVQDAAETDDSELASPLPR